MKTASELDRRRFLQGVGGAAAAIAAFTPGRALASPDASDGEELALEGGPLSRRQRSLQLRRDVALEEFKVPVPRHRNNGDEERYPNRIGSFSKGLVHNRLGEVDLASYASLHHALSTGEPEDFERIIMGAPQGQQVKLVNPQAGLAFDLEGTDSHQMALGPPPALASAERAGEAVECYWMALLRDVNFTRYASDATALEASDELSRMSDFRGPKENGRVTPLTLFRGFTTGDLIGPYVSQFLLKTVDFGAVTVEQKFNTYRPGTDYMIDPASWLAVQDGRGPFPSNQIDPRPRHIRNGRDLSAYVHIDVLFEAYFNACLWLIDNGAPLNRGNPYGSNRSRTQVGFGMFGAPHVKALLAEVATRALKAVWFQKWFVHRTLRPEEFGGLVHFRKTGEADYPLHSDVLNSQAVARTFQRNGTYFLPHAFPEGCPQHPSYGQGHATVAGACATIVKAFFDDSFMLSGITDIVQASEDGLSLAPYTGQDVDRITVGGEMNKTAANVGVGRNHAAVHWRSDYADSLPLGEAIAISVLRDQRPTCNEHFEGFTFTKFDGTQIIV